jgi:hypothetical protein
MMARVTLHHSLSFECGFLNLDAYFKMQTLVFSLTVVAAVLIPGERADCLIIQSTINSATNPSVQGNTVSRT